MPLHSAAFNIGWRGIAGALRALGDLVRGAPDEARAGFFLESAGRDTNEGRTNAYQTALLEGNATVSEARARFELKE